MKGGFGDFALCARWALGNCYVGEAGVSLSEEARTKTHEADNAEDDFASHQRLGMVQAWVAQKLIKPNILRVFMMSLFCSLRPRFH